MEVLFALIAGVLVFSGVFLLLSRAVVRVVLGLAFIAYAANLIILTAAGLRQAAPPLLTLPGPYADPLPQALILTAIVIGFATTALLLTVALRAYQVAGHDDVAAFGDSLARSAARQDGRRADPAHPSADLPPAELDGSDDEDIDPDELEPDEHSLARRRGILRGEAGLGGPEPGETGSSETGLTEAAPGETDGGGR